eukprot:234718-Prymnesium_polylepis.1
MSGREVFKGNHERMGCACDRKRQIGTTSARAGPSRTSHRTQKRHMIDSTTETGATLRTHHLHTI